ncbi:MAG: PAS domain S-box protein [Melioribacteraceae bacterium]
MDSKQHTILLVEDDSLLAATEIYWLKKAGYLVKHVSTGEDAVKTVNETVKGIDLVLMDINLGDGMDGTEAARIILKSHEIPLLFLSSHTEKEIVAKTEKITSYGYVVKDSKNVVLLASIKMAFKLFNANQGLLNKEKAIIESERKYKDLFEKSDDAILIINNFKFVDCNTATLKMLGYNTKEELLNAHPSEISPEFQPDGKPSLEKANEMMFMTLEKGSHRFEWDHKKADGTIFPVEVLLTAIDADPKNSVIHTVWRDITERKEVLTKLAESESNYRMLIENQTDLVVKVDLNGRFQFVSPSYCRTFGKAQNELLGKAFIPLVHEEDRETTLKAMEALFSQPYTVNVEQRAMTKEGWRWFSWVDTAILDNDGKVESIIGVGRDVTERKFAEQELRRSEEKFRNLIVKMPDAVYKSTHEGKFLEVNPAMVQMLGYKDENELLEIDIKKDLYFDVAERESAALIEKYEEMAVFRLRKKDGSEIWVEDHGRHVLDQDGNVLYHEGIMRDVTERIHNELEIQKYSEQLKGSNAAKDKLISIISHDLKNPFHSINSAVKLVIEEWSEISEEDKLKFLKAVLNTSEKSYNLLENLLLWSRQQMDKIEFLPERISLSEIVLDTVEIVKNAATLKGIIIKNNIRDGAYVKADRMMISTVIRNLLTNAIKFTGEKGIVEIHAETHNDRIDLAISDNGIGISAEDIEKLFRIDLTYSTKGTNSEGGTGLGLIIAKDFVEKNNGTIWVESEFNKGTKFVVSLERSLQ